jgi:UDPglucose--hexose-1-phosphate uridylyltransferase
VSELRWHPILRQWVITATTRQERTFLPPKDFCPLCPQVPGGEIAAPSYDIVVFENRFPSLQRLPPEPAVAPTPLSPVRPAQGTCEVVVYTQRHDVTFAGLDVLQIEKLIAVWQDRYRALGARPDVDYVFIFENKGEVIGVTLHHPHGQIYATPFVPPIPEQELRSAADHFAETGRCLFCDVLRVEEDDGRRLVAGNDRFAAFIPFFARWPYETYVFPRRHLQSLDEFDAADRRDLARLLKRLTLGFDGLFGFSLPYMMVMHQRPTAGKEYPGAHFHIEFYPPNRSATKLKYLAGVESGAGSYINDTLAEEKAAALRAALPPEPL